MQIEVQWLGPFPLIDGSDQNLIYVLEELSVLPESPGVYVFGRRYGNDMIPIYIGMAKNLETRIENQLCNVKLMKGIDNAPQGERMILIGKLKKKPGQNANKVLRIIESALIEHSLAEGYDILNKLGTNTPVHEIKFRGKRMATNFSGRNVKARMRE